MSKRPPLPPFYRVEQIAENDYSAYLYAGAPEGVPDSPAELISVNGENSWTEQGLAEAAAWADFNTRENVGDWPMYLASLDLREIFDGFPLTDEHREVAEGMAAHFADAFAQANQSAPTTDTVVMGAHLRTFAEKAAEDTGGKTSKLVQAIFNGDTTLSQATSLMLAALVIRMYNAPYGGLNEAGLDFVNVLVAVLDIVSKTTGKSPKFGGVAKGKRPK